MRHRERRRDDRSTRPAQRAASWQPGRRAPAGTRPPSPAGKCSMLALRRSRLSALPGLRRTADITRPTHHQGRAAPNRHSGVAFDLHCGVGRGFLPRGLSDTCPQAGVHRRHAACSGRCPTTLNISRHSPRSASRHGEVCPCKSAIRPCPTCRLRPACGVLSNSRSKSAFCWPRGLGAPQAKHGAGHGEDESGQHRRRSERAQMRQREGAARVAHKAQGK